MALTIKIRSQLPFVLCLGIISLSHGITPQCPDFSATINEVIDQVIDDPNFVVPDPELVFFKDIMGFRNSDIRHFFFDAVRFFNETYGLDFSKTPINDQYQSALGNAQFDPFMFREDIVFRVIFNNWVQTGSTCTSCASINDGGFSVTFTGDMLLRGSYGGEDGILVGVGNSIAFGYLKINVCKQSPVILQYRTTLPIRAEPVDDTTIINLDVYNNVLGYGSGLGALTLKPIPERPGSFHLKKQVLYTFPSN